MRDAMPSRLCIHPRRRDPQQRGDLLRSEEPAAPWRLLLAGLVHRRVIDPKQPQAANELPNRRCTGLAAIRTGRLNRSP